MEITETALDSQTEGAKRNIICKVQNIEQKYSFENRLKIFG